MIRALALSLLLAAVVAGQRPRSRQDAPAPSPLTFDATVAGPDGQVIPDLTAADFELTHRGEVREISSLAWMPTATRNVIVMVDDLGLTPEQVTARQVRLRAFLSQLSPTDRAALVRISSGAGWQELLTADRQPLLEQIERIQPIAQGISDATVASAIAEAIRWAVEETQWLGERKAMVLLADHARIAALRRNESLTSMMNRNTVVFYVVDSPGDISKVDLAYQTGGTIVPDLGTVLRDQEGFYKISFVPAAGGLQNVPAILKLKGKSGDLRWRYAFQSQVLAPLEAPAAAAGGDLRVYLTALFTGFSGPAPTVDALVHVEGRDVSILRDLKGIRHGSLDVQVAPYGIGGRAPGMTSRSVQLDLNSADYEKLIKEGMQFTTRVTLPAAGPLQIRAIVNDGTSGRAGAAMEFLEVPMANQNTLSISGLMLKKPTPPATPGGDAPREELFDVAIYHPGETVNFVYGVFNATSGPEKDALLRVRTRVCAGGKLIYQGSASELRFPAAVNGVRQVTSKVNLDKHVSPGSYSIEVEVTDLLAKDGPPRVATQHRAFEVRE
jgi:hypothetical protein